MRSILTILLCVTLCLSALVVHAQGKLVSDFGITSDLMSTAKVSYRYDFDKLFYAEPGVRLLVSNQSTKAVYSGSLGIFKKDSAFSFHAGIGLYYHDYTVAGKFDKKQVLPGASVRFDFKRGSLCAEWNGRQGIVSGYYPLMKTHYRAKNYWNKQLAIASLSFTGGFVGGIPDFTRNNYSAFKDRHPNANDQFFNPRLSADNKYKPGTKEPAFTVMGMRSDRALVFVTDGWHLYKFIDVALLSMSAGMTLTLYDFPKGTKFGKKLIRGLGEALLIHLAHSAGKAACFAFYKVTPP